MSEKNDGGYVEIENISSNASDTCLPETLVAETSLTATQKARMERNRLKALTLKDAKLMPHPYAKIDDGAVKKTTYNVQGTHYIDSGGGFLIEENVNESSAVPPKLVKRPAPIIDPTERPVCLECNQQFAESYLFHTFNYNACDNCRDNEDKHSLITRTEAKTEYLLKDCDLDKREPVLKFIHRKNPHNPRWGEMKLYLHVQIEQRALEVWGSEENLLTEKEQRQEKKEKSKLKKYSKELKALRMNVRGSLYDKTKGKSHTHSFGEEKYNEADDTYMRNTRKLAYVNPSTVKEADEVQRL